MGLVVSRQVTSKGYICQKTNCTKLVLKNVKCLRLIEQSTGEEATILGNTKISPTNLVCYLKNKKCDVQGVIVINDVEYNVNVLSAKYCNEKLIVYLEKNEELPLGCNCISLTVFSCLGDDTSISERILNENLNRMNLSDEKREELQRIIQS